MLQLQKGAMVDNFIGEAFWELLYLNDTEGKNIILIDSIKDIIPM